MIPINAFAVIPAKAGIQLALDLKELDSGSALRSARNDEKIFQLLWSGGNLVFKKLTNLHPGLSGLWKLWIEDLPYMDHPGPGLQFYR